MIAVSELLLRETLLQAAKRLKGTDLKVVPVTNLSRLAGDKIDIDRCAHKICDACIRVGFIYVRGHGVPQKVINRAFKMSRELFRVPNEEKMEIYINKNETDKGYKNIHNRSVDPQTKGGESSMLVRGFNKESLRATILADFQEAFNFGYKPVVDFQIPIYSHSLNTTARSVQMSGLKASVISGSIGPINILLHFSLLLHPNTTPLATKT